MAYNYAELNSLPHGDMCHAYGVIIDYKPPAPSRGTDWVSSVMIVDESCKGRADAFQVMIFGPSAEHLPNINKAGDIIRLHRMKRTNYSGAHQQTTGKIKAGGAGFSFLVWDGGERQSMEPYSRGVVTHVTMNDTERDRLRAIRVWWRNNMDKFGYFSAPAAGGTPSASASTSSYVKKLGDMSADCGYFDMICLVLAVGQKSRLLVWDGTDPRVSKDKDKDKKRKFSHSHSDVTPTPAPTIPLPYDTLSPQEGWPELGARVWIDVFESMSSYVAKTVQPDKWYRIRNIRLIKTINSLAIQFFERSTILPLPEDHADVKALTQMYSAIHQYVRKQVVTSTIHSGAPLTLIRDVKAHPAPGKFRISGSLIDYNPKNMEDFVKATCCGCNRWLNVASDFSAQAQSWLCQHCGKRMELSECVYLYAFSISIHDNTESIDIILADKDAEAFLSGISPSDFNRDMAVRGAIRKKLDSLKASSSSSIVECWVKSYVVSVSVNEKEEKETRYRLFGTRMTV